MLALTEVNSGCVVSIDEDLLESEAKEIVSGLLDVLPVLSNELAGRLGEDKIDFLEGLVLGLGHEEELVEPSVAEVQLACFRKVEFAGGARVLAPRAKLRRNAETPL